MILHQFSDRPRKWAVALILATSFVFKFIYIFYFSSYLSSVTYDMAAYWNNSFELAWGSQVTINQFGLFPTFYKFFLSYWIRIIDFFHMLPNALNTTIILNISLSTVAAYFVYAIAKTVLSNRMFCLFILFLYAFSYPATYINALILPENLATPAIIVSVALLICYRSNLWILFMSGILLGTAVSAKPMLIFMVLPFGAYVLFGREAFQKPIFRIGVFVFGFMLLPAATLMVNYQISDGKLLSFGSNGGVNFFQAYCHPGKVVSSSDAGSFWVKSPSVVGREAEYEDVTVREPFYNQKYFYRLGFNCIKENPKIWFEKLLDLKNLYFGYLMPTLSKTPPGQKMFLEINKTLLLFMSAFLGLSYLVFLKDGGNRNFLFLFSVIVAYLLTVYFISMPERRYLYMVEFVIYIEFFVILNFLVKNFYLYKYHLVSYFLIVLCCYTLMKMLVGWL